MKILSFYSSLKIDRPSVYTQSYKLLTILQQVFCFIMVTTPTQVGFFISLGAGFFFALWLLSERISIHFACHVDYLRRL